jgi:hypothetical protein
MGGKASVAVPLNGGFFALPAESCPSAYGQIATCNSTKPGVMLNGEEGWGADTRRSGFRRQDDGLSIAN